MYYECHITIDLHLVSARTLIEAHNWKFSKINGDPSFGDKCFEYATRHASAGTSLLVIIDTVNHMAQVLKEMGFPVIRQKIELVMYDTKGLEFA